MLTVIADKRDIAACQKQVIAAVRKLTSQRRRSRIGFPSGTFEADVCYVTKLDFWVAFEDWGDRFCNACGIGDPFARATPAPHLEINPPTAGINRRTAGAFVIDDEGRRYLAHSGKVGGGTRGVSPTNFRAYHDAHVLVDWGGVQRDAYVLADLDDGPMLVEEMRNLTQISKEFREEVKARLKSRERRVTLKTQHAFRPEFEGTKTFTTKEQIVARVMHGKVVRTLRQVLHKHVTLFNDANRDLYAHDASGRVTALLEVKTSSATTS
jgi:hypothetical protein